MSAKQRKPLSESLQATEEFTPAMEAFRKGVTPLASASATPEATAQPSPELPKEKEPKPKNRKLVIELEPELYDAFATHCFQRKVKMSTVVRAFIASQVEGDQQ